MTRVYTLGLDAWQTIDSNGQLNLPTQSSFLAYLGTTDETVTGAGNTYTFGSGNALTILFDQNSNMNTNGIFTAPATGKYTFQSSISMGTLSVAMTEGVMYLVTTGNTFAAAHVAPGLARGPSGLYTFSIAIVCNMTAGDTAKIQIVISNGIVNTASAQAGSDNISCWFSGSLVA